MSSKAEIENVSDTALWVAAFRGAESRRPDALFQDPLSSLLAGEKGERLTKSMPFQEIVKWHMAVRTVAIDRLIDEALKRGVDMVINIGAGLDTRPYRLDLPPDLQWVEIDFPHLIEMKNEKLRDEKPRCRLTRIGLDFSDRAAVQRTYSDLGAQAKKALIITEGVIVYLTNEQAARLSETLKSIQSFEYWIQDYRRFDKNLRPPRKLKKKLKNAPFRFQHEDPIRFFTEHGWHLQENILEFDEGLRLGRKFPFGFPWKYLIWLVPASRKESFRKMTGFALFSSHERGRG